jgi:hypothetical protein
MFSLSNLFSKSKTKTKKLNHQVNLIQIKQKIIKLKNLVIQIQLKNYVVKNIKIKL